MRTGSSTWTTVQTDTATSYIAATPNKGSTKVGRGKTGYTYSFRFKVHLMYVITYLLEFIYNLYWSVSETGETSSTDTTEETEYSSIELPRDATAEPKGKSRGSEMQNKDTMACMHGSYFEPWYDHS